MSRCRWGTAVLLLVLAGCGARSALEEADSAGGRGGEGGGTTPLGGGGAGTGGVFDDCVAPAFKAGGVGALVVRTEGETAYYTTLDDRILRGDLEAATEVELLADPVAVGDIAVFEGTLYYSDAHGLWQMPEGGGEPALVLSFAGPSYSIAVDATGIYWVEGPSSLSFHFIKRRAPSGEVTVLASNVQLPLGLSVGPLGLVYTDPYDLLAEAGAVRAVSIDGASSTLVASARPYPELPFQRDGIIYWVETRSPRFTNEGGIARAAPGGAPPEEVFSFESQYPIWATADGAAFYATVLREDQSATELLSGAFPVANGQRVIAESEPDEFFTAVATTPKRIVWTVQPSDPEGSPVDGVRSLCRSQL